MCFERRKVDDIFSEKEFGKHDLITINLIEGPSFKFRLVFNLAHILFLKIKLSQNAVFAIDLLQFIQP